MVSSAFLVRNLVVDPRHLQTPVSLHPRQTPAAVSWELEARAGLEERGRTLQLGFSWEVAACGAWIVGASPLTCTGASSSSYGFCFFLCPTLMPLCHFVITVAWWVSESTDFLAVFLYSCVPWPLFQLLVACPAVALIGSTALPKPPFTLG